MPEHRVSSAADDGRASPDDIASTLVAGSQPSGRTDWAGALAALAAAAVGAAAIAYSGDFSDLGSVFPRTIGALLVALGIACAGLSLAGRLPRPAPLEGSNLRRFALIVTMLAWAFALPYLGFLAAGAAACAVLLLIANHDRWHARSIAVYALSTGGVLIGLYLLFGVVLKVPLP